MSETAERLCLQCSKEIPKWKAKGDKFCSGVCRINFRDEERKRKAADRAFQAKSEGKVRCHSCLANQLDPFQKEACSCRLMVTEEQAKRLVSRGEAADFSSRSNIFTGGPILLIGKLKRTPRVPTLEKSHLERANISYNTKHLRGKSLEELQRIAEASRAERAAEEKVRIEIYGELAADVLRHLIVEVPAEEFDRKEAEAWGRPFVFHTEEERTSISVDVSNLRAAIGADEETEIKEAEPEDVVTEEPEGEESEIEVEETQDEDIVESEVIG